MVFKLLRQGENCVLVGTASVSKSNFLHFLLRTDVRTFYLGQDNERTLLLYVDLNRCSAAAEWAYCELVLNTLVIECNRMNIDADILSMLSDLHKEVALSKDRLLAQRYLERAVWLICGQLGWRLVIILDEADEFYRISDAQFLCNLRAMRDDYKYKLSFLLATRQTLDRLRPADVEDETEAFDELFSRNNVGLRPYNHDDASRMIDQLVVRKEAFITIEQRRAILELSGGHPGLLSASFDLFARNPSISIPVGLQAFLEDDGIAVECVRIWDSLQEDEQQGLQQIAANVHPAPTVLDILALKGLIAVGTDGGPRIFSSLYQKYVESCSNEGTTDFIIEEGTKSILAGGRRIRGLSPLEFDLIKYLFENRGKVQSRDDILEALYPEEDYAAGMQDNRVDNLIRRIRTRIEVNPGKPRFIHTIRGHGYLLGDDPNKKTQ